MQRCNKRSRPYILKNRCPTSVEKKKKGGGGGGEGNTEEEAESIYIYTKVGPFHFLLWLAFFFFLEMHSFTPVPVYSPQWLIQLT